jgi:hypothetical protein
VILSPGLNVLMRFCHRVDCLFVCKAKEGRYVRILDKITSNSFYEMIGKNAYLIFKIDIYYFNYRETTCSLARQFLCHVFEAKNENQVLE